MFNILYNGRIIHKELTEEECKQVLLLLAEQVADNKIDKDLIDVEEI
jgi:hypothetical protein